MFDLPSESWKHNRDYDGVNDEKDEVVLPPTCSIAIGVTTLTAKFHIRWFAVRTRAIGTHSRVGATSVQ
jgi:hypothetical protein